MQPALIPVLHFSAQKDPLIADVMLAMNSQYSYRYLQHEDELLDAIVDGKSFVLLIDSSYYDWAMNVLNKFNRESIYVILLGSLKVKNGSLFDIVPVPVDRVKLALSLGHAHSQILLQQEIHRLQSTLTVQNQELKELNHIGIALSSERDPDKLLELILFKSREITRADAGSLYLVEVKDDLPEDENNYFANKQLRFKLAQNDSIDVGFKEFVMSFEKKSVAGYVALTGQVLNIADVYQIPPNAEYSHNRRFDESIGYRAKSMLVIPMKTHKDEIIGVLQLINRKKEWSHRVNKPDMVEEHVVPFDEKCVSLASSLASQAAVSIENTRLYEEIKKLFEGFIKASVHAIEQRDPTTSGHSERVAVLTTGLAETLNKVNTGKYKDLRFSRNHIVEINYAALLHDFGKIGVREDVLVKAKKLFPYELDSVNYRFRLVKKANELKFSKDKIRHLIEDEKATALMTLEEIDRHFGQLQHQLEEYWKIIVEANEPRILKESGHELLVKIGELTFQEHGETDRLLTPDEIKRLSIPKGSLSTEERLEIESHVTHTFNFLSRIPWTQELKNVPFYAYAHHEKLDGSGYPRNLGSEKIPIQSQMMTIADIYDALTAWDRPYKKAVPVEKALEILGYEVKDGKIDAELYNIFLEAKIYELVKKPEGVR